ncbi:hypothetical protein ACFPRL_32510 [Pseudoclavibacter helvolus]
MGSPCRSASARASSTAPRSSYSHNGQKKSPHASTTHTRRPIHLARSLTIKEKHHGTYQRRSSRGTR